MTRDAVVFYSRFDDPVAWRNALQAELPDLKFCVAPDIDDPTRCATRWCGSRRPDSFRRFPISRWWSISVPASTRWFARGDLPDVPISRLSDDGMVSLMTSYVLFAVIRYARDIPALERAQRRREWHYIHPRALSGIKVGVLGLGELGSAAAAALAQVGFDVTGWARTEKMIPGVRCVAGRAMLDTVIAEAEILVVLLPLTPDTRGLIGARELA